MEPQGAAGADVMRGTIKEGILKTPVLRGMLISGGIMVMAFLILSAMAGSSAYAASGHIFDPQLSLTGGCTTSSDDPVPDPDCPYPAPPGGPTESFNRVSGVAIDSFGAVYVASAGPLDNGAPHIDIFGSDGSFIAELGENIPVAPRTVAVDSQGYLYVYGVNSATNKWDLYRFDPVVYDPIGREISYETTPTVVVADGTNYAALAVNPENDHLFVNFGRDLSTGGAIMEFGPGSGGSPVVDDDVASVCCFDGPGLAIDAARDRLYATDQVTDTSPRIIRVFDLAEPHALIETIDGSSTPSGGFVTAEQLSIAVDESTGNLFAYLQEKFNLIYELTESGQYLATIEHNLLSQERHQQVAIDNGANSPNGVLNPEGRYLWATAQPPGVGHAYAFKPTQVEPPEVESLTVGEVSEDEALLEAAINPGQAETSYRLEYVSKNEFDSTGFDNARQAGQGSIPAVSLPVSVSGQVTGLTAGTAYVFRVVATNEVGSDEITSEFKTYPASVQAPCPNDQFRTGPSAALPDCRAYELITPPDTAGRPPMGMGLLGLPFASLPASPDGSRLSFRIENGLIPGFDATGSFPGDPYLSTRGNQGWTTVATGGDGTEATAVSPSGRSPDQTYSVWVAEGLGPAVLGDDRTTYVRYPDGHSELLGQGSLATDPHAKPKLISENGGHMVFTSLLHLEEASPPAGQSAVYDRTADGVTHVVSVLPGGETPSDAMSVQYRGSSVDGVGIGFQVIDGPTATLYLRHNNETTFAVGAGVTFEGIAEGGKRIFYLKNGSLYAFDIDKGTVPFATSGNVTVVNISADGTTAYFVSTTKLTAKANPLGDKAVAGKENLYQSREGSISFVGSVSQDDVLGESKNIDINGLGLWVDAVGGGNNTPGGFAADPSRTTPNGNVLLFQSDANLTDYDSGGRRQIYRYDSAEPDLQCLSCNPTGVLPTGDALLQDVDIGSGTGEPNTVYDVVQNLSMDGKRAFFQSKDPLVATDTNGLQDVYEWEADGVGSCETSGGCVYLISSGHSGKVNYLYAASASGDDVFFRTSDLLQPEDKETIPSIYNARVGGGFPQSASSASCVGEGCRPQLTPAPVLPSPGGSPGRSGNVRPKCPKGKRKVERPGKVRCVKKHRKHRAPKAKGAGR